MNDFSAASFSNKRSENIEIEANSSQIESQIVPVKKESLWHRIMNKIKILFKSNKAKDLFETHVFFKQVF